MYQFKFISVRFFSINPYSDQGQWKYSQKKFEYERKLVSFGNFHAIN